MKSIPPEQFRLSPDQATRLGLPRHLGSDASFGMNGMFLLPRVREVLRVIASDGAGIENDTGQWEHVSVSLRHRCPTWEEMNFVKDIFFEPEEAVMQFHPPRADYVNNHPYCLHLWRPKQIAIPLPPSILVGIKTP